MLNCQIFEKYHESIYSTYSGCSCFGSRFCFGLLCPPAQGGKPDSCVGQMETGHKTCEVRITTNSSGKRIGVYSCVMVKGAGANECVSDANCCPGGNCNATPPEPPSGTPVRYHCNTQSWTCFQSSSGAYATYNSCTANCKAGTPAPTPTPTPTPTPIPPCEVTISAEQKTVFQSQSINLSWQSSNCTDKSTGECSFDGVINDSASQQEKNSPCDSGPGSNKFDGKNLPSSVTDYVVVPSPNAHGTYTYTIKSQDSAGNTSEDSVKVKVLPIPNWKETNPGELQTFFQRMLSAVSEFFPLNR